MKKMFFTGLLIVSIFSGCEAGLTSNDNTGTSGEDDMFSFSEMYSDIKKLKEEIIRLKQVNEEQETALKSVTEINENQVGMIIPFAGSKDAIPHGWLICDGSEVSRKTYQKLFAVINGNWGNGNQVDTFNLPDLRGRFLRGVDFEKQGETKPLLDPGREIGSYQKDAFQGHKHNYSYSRHPTGGGPNGVEFGGGKWGDYTQFKILDPSNDGTNGNPRTAKETRPVNAAVNYIIKY
ncbi:MAG: tail fiber protein [bacterium]|nr:tail fiber protein [bacterium]